VTSRKKENRHLHLKGKLISLLPLLDRNGLLRVGGRIKEGRFPNFKRHQIILSENHRLRRKNFIGAKIRLHRYFAKCIEQIKFYMFLQNNQIEWHFNTPHLTQVDDLIVQQRFKWRSSPHNLAIVDLVLIQDDNLPPLKWSLGRVKSIVPGDDHYVRVVTMKTTVWGN
jgi:hypothetical protein